MGGLSEVVEPEWLVFTISDRPEKDLYELIVVVLADLGDGRTEMAFEQHGRMSARGVRTRRVGLGVLLRPYGRPPRGPRSSTSAESELDEPRGGPSADAGGGTRTRTPLRGTPAFKAGASHPFRHPGGRVYAAATSRAGAGSGRTAPARGTGARGRTPRRRPRRTSCTSPEIRCPCRRLTTQAPRANLSPSGRAGP